MEIINFNCIEAIIYRNALLFPRDYSIFEGCGVETNGFVLNIGKNVKSMYYPNSSITLIKDKSLIKEINLDKENINFIVENNCLIDVDKKALIMGLNVENITISNNVIIIADYAFYKCDKLKSVVISESVNYINSYAFGICSNLLSMEFLSSDMWIQETSSTLYGEPFSVSDKYANVEKIGINSYDTKKVINQ